MLEKERETRETLSNGMRSSWRERERERDIFSLEIESREREFLKVDSLNLRHGYRNFIGELNLEGVCFFGRLLVRELMCLFKMRERERRLFPLRFP